MEEIKSTLILHVRSQLKVRQFNILARMCADHVFTCQASLVSKSGISFVCYLRDAPHWALILDVYSKEVYSLAGWQRLSQSGPELWGDDSADGLIEIISAGRSV